MAFDIQKFENDTSGAGDAPRLWTYRNTDDTLIEIEEEGYFNEVYHELNLGDMIYVVASDGNQKRSVGSAINTLPVQTNGFVFSGQVQTADIEDDAVTEDKLDGSVSGAGLVGGAGVVLSVQVDAVGIEVNVDTLRVKDLGVATGKVALAIPKTVTVALTPTEFNGMYAAPKVLVAAPGANKLHRVSSVVYELDYGGTQYANGGAVAVQYDSTINGAGTLASATTAAATFNGYTADSTVGAQGALATGASSATVNKGLYLSNITGAFTTGNSAVRVHITYSTVSTTI